MKGYRTDRYTPARVPGAPLTLSPPLELAWVHEGGTWDCRTDGESVYTVVSKGNELFYCRLDDSGRAVWGRRGSINNAVLVNEEIAGLGEADSRSELVVLSAATGEDVVRQATAFDPVAHVPGGLLCIGSTVNEETDDWGTPTRQQVKRTLALLSREPAFLPLWSVETTGDRTQGDLEIFDLTAATAEGRVILGRGRGLAAISVDSGSSLWTTDLTPIGGATSSGRWNPMISEGRVVVEIASGTAAFDVASGTVLWSSRVRGARVLYGGRVYVLDPNGTYWVLDLGDGRVLTQAPLVAWMREMARRPTTITTHLAVTETHVFGGDSAGRLWAFERETGRPVWHHRPENTIGYLGANPVIVEGRLLIWSSSVGNAAGSLYCYEQA